MAFNDIKTLYLLLFTVKHYLKHITNAAHQYLKAQSFTSFLDSVNLDLVPPKNSGVIERYKIMGKTTLGPSIK